MSSRSLLAITVGAAGAIILGYCIYFDQKRRSHPEYKRKVFERRQRDSKHQIVGTSDSSESNEVMEPQIDNSLEKPSDQEALERCFYNEMKLGEQLINNGNIADGVSHFANGLLMLSQPSSVIQTLKENLPDFVFMPLLIKLNELQSNSSSTKDTSTTSITDS